MYMYLACAKRGALENLFILTRFPSQFDSVNSSPLIYSDKHLDNFLVINLNTEYEIPGKKIVVVVWEFLVVVYCAVTL